MSIIANTKHIIILSLFLSAVSVEAQTFGFYRTSDPVIYTNDTFGVISHAKINNYLGSANELRLIKRVMNVPFGWEACICDIVQCHPPGIDSAIADYPSGLSNIDIMIYSHSIPGTGYITIRAEKVSNPNEHYDVVFGGAFNPIGIQQISTVADEFNLGQNYPNPFNPSTKINFSIAKSSFVMLKVYSILGSEVSTLVIQNLNSGKYELDFDASWLSSGMYYYVLRAGDYVSIKKMVLVR